MNKRSNLFQTHLKLTIFISCEQYWKVSKSIFKFKSILKVFMVSDLSKTKGQPFYLQRVPRIIQLYEPYWKIGFNFFTILDYETILFLSVHSIISKA